MNGAEAISAFGAYGRKRNLAPSTILIRRQRLEQLARWLGKPLLDATTEDLEKWLGSRDLAPLTVTTYISYLSSFYDFAVRSHLVAEDPTEDLIRPKVPFTMKRPWDPAEIAHAVAQANDRMRCLLLLPLFAGARCVEMSRLCGEDVDRQRDALLLHGKGGKDRVVPLHELVREALSIYGLPRSGPVFLRDRKAGGPLKPNTISKYVSTHLHSLGFATTAHRGRSAYATAMYELSGGDLMMVAELLGHTNLSHCRRYVAWSRSKASVVSARLAFPV